MIYRHGNCLFFNSLRPGAPLCVIFIISLLFPGCASQRRSIPLREEEPQNVRDMSWTIPDYRDREKGLGLPDWVTFYLQGNIAAIENMAEYRNYYVFVSVAHSNNFSALSQWNAAFTPELDFARLAAVRIERRFLNAAAAWPDDEYGSYFECMIRAVSDARWEGAYRHDDFWLYRSFPETDEHKTDKDGFDYLILVIIRKEIMELQTKIILDSVVPEVPLTRDQRSAVNRVRERFFDYF